MSFTVDDFNDLLRLLDEHPEWQAELRRRFLSDDFLALPTIVRQLAEAQARSETRLDRIEAALERLVESHHQMRTELTELADSHRQLRGDVTTLGGEVTSLKEGVTTLGGEVTSLREDVTTLGGEVTSLRADVSSLGDRVSSLGDEVSSLRASIGATIESDSEAALAEAVGAHGWELLGEARPISVNGEVDIAVPVREASGAQFWVLVEAKLRLRRREVINWARTLEDIEFRRRLATAEVTGPILAYAFGVRIYRDAEDAARALGVGILTPHGERVEPARRW